MGINTAFRPPYRSMSDMLVTYVISDNLDATNFNIPFNI